MADRADDGTQPRVICEVEPAARAVEEERRRCRSVGQTIGAHKAGAGSGSEGSVEHHYLMAADAFGLSGNLIQPKACVYMI